jgi:hypothetical protein
LANARVVLARNTDLLAKKVIASQDFDTSKYQTDQFEAAVKAETGGPENCKSAERIPIVSRDLKTAKELVGCWLPLYEHFRTLYPTASGNIPFDGRRDLAGSARL